MSNNNNNNNNSNSEDTVRASSDLLSALTIVFLLGPIAIFIPIPFTGIIWFGIFSVMFVLYLYLLLVFEPITENPYQYLSEEAKDSFNLTNTYSNNSNSDEDSDVFNYQYVRRVVINLYDNIVEFITLIPYLITVFIQSFSSTSTSSTTTYQPLNR